MTNTRPTRRYTLSARICLTICTLGFLGAWVISYARYRDIASLGMGLTLLLGVTSLVIALRCHISGNAIVDRAARTILVLLFSSVLLVRWGGFLVNLPNSIHREPLLAASKESLSQIGKAMYMYSQDNGGFFPFDRRGSLASLSLLYPNYANDPTIFEAPVVAHSWSRRHDERGAFPEHTSLAGRPCDFGYTWRISVDAPPRFAVAADMPRNFVHKTETGAKETLGNVLSFDGIVHFATTPFFSVDPNDNIFAQEPGWSADTDSWIRQE